jgi:hypothetical protein
VGLQGRERKINRKMWRARPEAKRRINRQIDCATKRKKKITLRARAAKCARTFHGAALVEVVGRFGGVVHAPGPELNL